jgi:hypothetical protein
VRLRLTVFFVAGVDCFGIPLPPDATSRGGGGGGGAAESSSLVVRFSLRLADFWFFFAVLLRFSTMSSLPSREPSSSSALVSSYTNVSTLGDKQPASMPTSVHVPDKLQLISTGNLLLPFAPFFLPFFP